MRAALRVATPHDPRASGDPRGGAGVELEDVVVGVTKRAKESFDPKGVSGWGWMYDRCATTEPFEPPMSWPRSKHRRRAAAGAEHHNDVAMIDLGKPLLALGASPAMVTRSRRWQDFVAISDSLVMNIGTLSPTMVEAMERAVPAANDSRKPWRSIWSGAGQRHRTQTSGELATFGRLIIAANAQRDRQPPRVHTGEAPKGVDYPPPAPMRARRSRARRADRRRGGW